MPDVIERDDGRYAGHRSKKIDASGDQISITGCCGACETKIVMASPRQLGIFRGAVHSIVKSADFLAI